MGIFRSEPMRMGTLVLPQEGARDFVTAIGTNVQIQIQDMNEQTMMRGYKRQIQRLEELERILRFLVIEMQRIAEVSLSQLAADLDRSAEAAAADAAAAEGDLEIGVGSAAAAAPAPGPKPQVYVLDKVEEMLVKVYGQFLRFAQNNQELQREKAAAEEELAIVSFAASQLGSPLESAWHFPSRLAAAAAAATAVAAGDVAASASSSSCSSSALQQQQQQTSIPRAATADSHERSSSARRRRPTHLNSDGQQHEQQHSFELSASRSLLSQNVHAVENADLNGLIFSTVAGIICSKDQERFARALFRTTRGNAFTHFKRIDEDELAAHPNASEPKSLFVTYFQGSATGSAFMEKVKSVCAALGARLYPWPRTAGEAQQRQQQLLLLLQDKAAAAAAYEQYFLNEVAVFLEPVAAVDLPPIGDAAAAISAAVAAATVRKRPLITELRRFVMREKAVYTALNLFALSDATLRADCWFPENQETKLRQTLAGVAAEKNTSAFLLVHAAPGLGSGGGGAVPPTLFKTNSFLASFQGLVDTYGIARYREANPALFAAAIFPFLFGIMFGDVGHGLLLFLLAVALLIAKSQGKTFEDELGSMLLNARYMLLLLSLHSIFAGFLYNEVFSMGLNLFGSRWLLDENARASFQAETNVGPADAQHTWPGPYPFGVDPLWRGASNELIFLNSLKMKLAILVGFLHMLLGMGLCVLNTLHFRDWTGLCLSVIPQLLFYLSLIGFLVFLIVFKWLTPAHLYKKPSLIAVMIHFLMGGGGGGAGGSASLCLFDTQSFVEHVLRMVMLVTVPVMFLGKPLFALYVHRKQRPPEGFEYLTSREPSSIQLQPLQLQHIQQPLGQQKQQQEHGEETRSARFREREQRAAPVHPGLVHLQVQDVVEEPEEAGEVWLHTAIENIEFVLGTISNTASYLRLWALSLAHQQLSAVFFDKTVGAALEPGLTIPQMAFKLVFLYPVFFCVTIFVMVAMEALECFLHALRLQWVEFQNKFYKGDGVAFQPLDLNSLPEDSTM